MPTRANWSVGALESFLKEYKTSPEQTLATALGDVTIDEDDLSDEYDFMDEDEQGGERRRQERQQKRVPQYKYKDELQKLANRTSDEIIIDLDDLVAVCICALSILWMSADFFAVGGAATRRQPAIGRLHRDEHEALCRHHVQGCRQFHAGTRLRCYVRTCAPLGKQLQPTDTSQFQRRCTRHLDHAAAREECAVGTEPRR